MLLSIEKSDYELALVQREADVARAKLRLKQEEAEAEVARKAGKAPAKMGDFVFKMTKMLTDIFRDGFETGDTSMWSMTTP